MPMNAGTGHFRNICSLRGPGEGSNGSCERNEDSGGRAGGWLSVAAVLHGEHISTDCTRDRKGPGAAQSASIMRTSRRQHTRLRAWAGQRAPGAGQPKNLANTAGFGKLRVLCARCMSSSSRTAASGGFARLASRAMSRQPARCVPLGDRRRVPWCARSVQTGTASVGSWWNARYCRAGWRCIRRGPSCDMQLDDKGEGAAGHF